MTRELLDKSKLLDLLESFGRELNTKGRIYITGGGSALLFGWREMTVDLDIQADPEPARFYQVIADLKNTLQVNIELACPSQFIPPLPGWVSRSKLIDTYTKTDFYHYDFYSQALSKIERDHVRDRLDVKAMIDRKLVDLERLYDLFLEIKDDCIKYPNVDSSELENKIITLKSQ